MRKETALITGASSGIGLGLARRFAKDGSNVVLVARREDRLQEIAAELEAAHGIAATVVAKDLSDPDVPQQLFDALSAQGVAVDVLVNSAGFAARGAVAELSAERQMDLVQVNVAALTHLTRLFLPVMLERGRGGVLNVASLAAFQPGPYMAAYYASKAYVLSFSEALAEELRGTGVTVTCLAPGPTLTGFQAEAGLHAAPLFRFGSRPLQPVVDRGYKGFREGKTLVIPGVIGKASALGARIAPRALIRRLVARIQ